MYTFIRITLIPLYIYGTKHSQIKKWTVSFHWRVVYIMRPSLPCDIRFVAIWSIRLCDSSQVHLSMYKCPRGPKTNKRTYLHCTVSFALVLSVPCLFVASHAYSPASDSCKSSIVSEADSSDLRMRCRLLPRIGMLFLNLLLCKLRRLVLSIFVYVDFNNINIKRSAFAWLIDFSRIIVCKYE